MLSPETSDFAIALDKITGILNAHGVSLPEDLNPLLATKELLLHTDSDLVLPQLKKIENLVENVANLNFDDIISNLKEVEHKFLPPEIDPLIGEIENALNSYSSSKSRRKRYKFGRLFPSLSAFEAEDETLLFIGKPSNDSQNPAYMEDSQVRGTDNNSSIPVGLTYVGQLLTHDMSLDDTSQLGESNQPRRISNRATPWLDLDTIYKFNGVKAPRSDDDRAKLALGNNMGNDRDFARNDQGRAILADRRNDENNNIAQLAAVFMKFHNVMVDELRASGVPERKLFKKAKKLTVAHWQSVVVNEFLPSFVEGTTLNKIAENGRQFYNNGMARSGMIPVEFSVAANRFGHSNARGRYTLNEEFDRVRLFPLSESELDRNLLGGVPIGAERQIEWERFFDFSDYGIDNTGGSDQFGGLQVARKIDRLLARPLLRLPIGGPGLPDFVLDQENQVAGMPVVSLASLTLLRGKALGVPSGQDVARAMGFVPLTNDQFELNNPDEIVLPEPLDEAPLSLYILEEARIQNEGEKLGDVGGTILAEVVLGLLERDRASILNKNFVSPITHSSAVKMADIIAHIGWVDLPDNS
ncbi:hypothetical protein IQ249_19295 [Lusitaniella coriacea LEGE 07157]|uniref:Peroxidase n=1 Tax=Lusitaniella coriacea LEGE 07157 TaxID=945747 RepID=A0A8J7JD13_9CYAN|nr:peroxidase family protein [Lusitaniella coriacea]MBE9118045.1 hypothetical protein [Lusitaniella coriacea LEGE 07157]